MVHFDGSYIILFLQICYSIMLYSSSSIGGSVVEGNSLKVEVNDESQALIGKAEKKPF